MKKKAAGRQAIAGTTQTAIRLPDPVLERLDKLAKQMSRPPLVVTRTQALRSAIYRGLEQLEKEGRRK